jgi:hypothetical protein
MVARGRAAREAGGPFSSMRANGRRLASLVDLGIAWRRPGDVVNPRTVSLGSTVRVLCILGWCSSAATTADRCCPRDRCGPIRGARWGTAGEAEPGLHVTATAPPHPSGEARPW